MATSSFVRAKTRTSFRRKAATGELRRSLRECLNTASDPTGVPPKGVKESGSPQAGSMEGRPPAPAAQPWRCVFAAECGTSRARACAPSTPAPSGTGRSFAQTPARAASGPPPQRHPRRALRVTQAAKKKRQPSRHSAQVAAPTAGQPELVALADSRQSFAGSGASVAIVASLVLCAFRPCVRE